MLKQYLTRRAIVALFVSLFLVACWANDEEQRDLSGETNPEQNAVDEEAQPGGDGFLDADETADEEGMERFEDRDDERKEEFPGDDMEEKMIGVSVHEKVVARDATYSEGAPGPQAIKGLQEEEPTFVSLGDLAAEPSHYEEGVMTEASISRVLASNAFTLGEEEVLVVSADASDFEEDILHEGMPLRLAGIVRTFERADIENDFGLRLDQDFFAVFENQPVLIVAPDSVQETG